MIVFVRSANQSAEPSQQAPLISQLSLHTVITLDDDDDDDFQETPLKCNFVCEFCKFIGLSNVYITILNYFRRMNRFSIS